MFLYNVTFGIDPDIEKEWVAWMKSNHLPEVMKTSLFTENRFFKILLEKDDGTVSYSAQYLTPSIEKFQYYLDYHATSQLEGLRKKFDGKLVMFQTLLEEVK